MDFEIQSAIAVVELQIDFQMCLSCSEHSNCFVVVGTVVVAVVVTELVTELVTVVVTELVPELVPAFLLVVEMD